MESQHQLTAECGEEHRVAAVGAEEGIDGLIHVSDISWRHRAVHPTEMYKKGQAIDAGDLIIDRETKKFSLGLKQLVKDTREMREQNNTAGT
mgnify:CR=1 FL=1